MKRISYLLIILFSVSLLFAQESSQVTSQIALAIRQGSADQLAAYFGQTVDLTLSSSEGTYSKTQATLIMKDFFTQHPPASFEVKHQGSSDNGSLYMIGNYTSGKTTYRTYILLKTMTAAYIIQQIQFEEE
jgi:hypothetical protein